MIFEAAAGGGRWDEEGEEVGEEDGDEDIMCEDEDEDGDEEGEDEEEEQAGVTLAASSTVVAIWSVTPLHHDHAVA